MVHNGGVQNLPLWRRVARHVPALAYCAVLAIGLTWPLARDLDAGLLGSGAGDNVTWLWNVWWVRTALTESGASLMWTGALFAPLGTSLVLHTATFLPSIVAGLLPTGSLVSSLNLVVLGTVWLNAVSAYAAAYHLTRQRLPSLVAGTVFAAAPFLTVRLQGHLNTLSAWPLPLVVIAFDRMCRAPRTVPVLLLSVLVAALAYVDYYALVFAGVLVVLLTVFCRFEPTVTWRPPSSTIRWAFLGGTLGLLALVVGVCVWVVATGGANLSLAGWRVGIHSTFNLRAAAWVLAIVALLLWRIPAVRLAPRADSMPAGFWLRASVSAAIALALVAPLLIEGVRISTAGDYSSPSQRWRSATAGIDAASLFLGNPLHPLLGRAIAGVYSRFGIDGMESASWLGLAPIVLLVAGFRCRLSVPSIRRWLWAAGLFLVWSLGPYLMVFGVNTALMLPETVLRFLPVLSNARVPGRAFVGVVLAVALVGALVLASIGNRRRRTLLATLALAAALIDLWPRPWPVTAFEIPEPYRLLRLLPRGPVLEVPFGIRDGFGEVGRLDHRSLVYQTTHQQPLMGGFVARLSPRVRAAHMEDPVLGPLLQLSAGGAPTSDLPGDAAHSLACACRYVVVHIEAPEAARQFVASEFVLRELATDRHETLYAVEGLRRVRCFPQ